MAAKSVRNACLKSLRRGDLLPKGEIEESPQGRDAGAPPPDGGIPEIAAGQVLREALEALPVNFREVLILRELERLSYREIAEVIGMSTGTVISHLSRARDGLRLMSRKANPVGASQRARAAETT